MGKVAFVGRAITHNSSLDGRSISPNDESKCGFHVRSEGTFAVRHCNEPSDLIIDVVGAGRRF